MTLLDEGRNSVVKTSRESRLQTYQPAQWPIESQQSNVWQLGELLSEVQIQVHNQGTGVWGYLRWKAQSYRTLTVVKAEALTSKDSFVRNIQSSPLYQRMLLKLTGQQKQIDSEDSIEDDKAVHAYLDQLHTLATENLMKQTSHVARVKLHPWDSPLLAAILPLVLSTLRHTSKKHFPSLVGLVPRFPRPFLCEIVAQCVCACNMVPLLPSS